MKKMRTTARIACLLLAALMILLSVSCKKKPDTPDGETDTAGPVGTYSETSTPGSGNRYIVSGSNFRIVYADGGNKDSLNSAAVLFYNLVFEKLGRRMELKSDLIAEQEFEILVGDTNREGNVNIDDMTYYDYGWSFDGKKVRIYGGSVEAQENAVKRFFEKYFDEANKGVVVTEGEALTATYSYPYSSISLGGVDVSEITVASKFGYDSAAKAVAAGFGRLCGVKMNVLYGKDGADAPTGNYIFVGYDETEDLSMTCTYTNGVLRFIGNGLLGNFNQLDRLVEEFFKKNFTAGDTKTVDIVSITETKLIPQLENMQYADSGFIDTLNGSFELNKQIILTSESEYEATGSGKTYYVSNSGNDANDGLSPERAWATLQKVNGTDVPAGSVILFKRGDVWNRQGRLYSKSNVTFSAYGEGEKPLFSHYIDASLASDWTKVGDNLYVYSGAYESGTPYDYDGKDISADHPKLNIPGSYLTSTNFEGDDIGNILFNDDAGWGVKILKKNSSDFSVSIGETPTGFGTLTHYGKEFVDQNDLSQHLEFYHNPKESRLYLYCRGGNPAEVFENIKLVLTGYLFFGGTANVCHDVTVDNLAFKYAGCHGISINGAKNFTIQNCEIGWCGGSLQGYTWGGRDEPTRFGEGIQNWGNCDNFRIINNYIHQIYDGATSSQQSAWVGLSECVMQNVEVVGNCYEKCTAFIEFWMNLEPNQANSIKFMNKNWNISENLMRDAGYGFGATRPVSAEGGAVHFTDSNGWPKPLYENVLMTGNSSWGSKDGIISGLGWSTSMYNLEGNIFVHEYGTFLGTLARDFDNIMEWDIKTYYYDTETIELLTKKNVVGMNQFYYTYTK